MNNKKERIDEKFQERRNNDWMWRIVFSFFGGAVSFLVFITGVTPYILVNHDEYLLKSDLAQDYVKKEEYDNLKDQLKKLGTGSLQGKNINGLTPGNTKESGGSNIINNEKKIDYSKLNIIDEMVKEFYKKYGDLNIHAISVGGKEAEEQNLKRKLAKAEFIKIVVLICEAKLQDHYVEFIKDIDMGKYKEMVENNQIITKKKD